MKEVFEWIGAILVVAFVLGLLVVLFGGYILPAWAVVYGGLFTVGLLTSGTVWIIAAIAIATVCIVSAINRLGERKDN
jgi:hypothetical protein